MAEAPSSATLGGMAISAKGRRRIAVDGETYLWWVREFYDHPFCPTAPALGVASSDRRLLVRLPLGQPESTCHVIVHGPSFTGLAMSSSGRGGWRRFLAPRFGAAEGHGDTVTPGDVAAFVRWCRKVEPVIEVDWRGNPHDIPT